MLIFGHIWACESQGSMFVAARLG